MKWSKLIPFAAVLMIAACQPSYAGGEVTCPVVDVVCPVVVKESIDFVEIDRDVVVLPYVIGSGIVAATTEDEDFDVSASGFGLLAGLPMTDRFAIELGADRVTSDGLLGEHDTRFDERSNTMFLQGVYGVLTSRLGLDVIGGLGYRNVTVGIPAFETDGFNNNNDLTNESVTARAGLGLNLGLTDRLALVARTMYSIDLSDGETFEGLDECWDEVSRDHDDRGLEAGLGLRFQF